jgi:hypothetical protein
MSYIDAGYVVVLSTLVLYGLRLLWRHRRLAREVGE